MGLKAFHYSYHVDGADSLSSCFYGKQSTKDHIFHSDHIKVRVALNVHIFIYI